MAMNAFGHSLHFDMYGVSSQICESIDFCHDALVDLVEQLRMRRQSPPFLFRTPEEFGPAVAGLSGWVPLVESGISIHTLTKRAFVSVDVYTCGDLPQEEVVGFLRTRFDPSSWDEPRVMRRGVNYHRSPESNVD